MFLKISQSSQDNTGARVTFLAKLQASIIILKKEIPAPVFSCEFREICKNILLNRTLVVAASVSTIYYDSLCGQKQTDYVQRFLIKLLKSIKEPLSK